MANSNLNSLRDHLFATLAELRSEKPVDLKRVRSTVEVAQAIIETGKVEVDYLRLLGEVDERKSEFLGSPSDAPADDKPLPAGIVGRHVHRIRG